jgi:hypothetical protein
MITVTTADWRTTTAEIEDSMLCAETLARMLLLQLHRRPVEPGRSPGALWRTPPTSWLEILTPPRSTGFETPDLSIVFESPINPAAAFRGLNPIFSKNQQAIACVSAKARCRD